MEEGRARRRERREQHGGLGKNAAAHDRGLPVDMEAADGEPESG
jgi:hypothetical protein